MKIWIYEFTNVKKMFVHIEIHFVSTQIKPRRVAADLVCTLNFKLKLYEFTKYEN